VEDKVALGQVFPCQFDSTVVPLLGKMKETDHLSLHLHHRVAQYALRLRCFRSFCCGALPKKKKKSKWSDGLNKSVMKVLLRICCT
jgi:hypothetical protein